MNRRSITYFILGILILLVSSPSGHSLVNIVYRNTNLTGEYVPILNGFIHSLMLIGILVFSVGIITYIKDNK
ncbi:glycosyl transferase [Ornithinibacillus salinisoli]|uniref:Glycosyl transferase n=1 Tax=Ornithinibacillus salinisoli TaxID=1848459 RepID=A0ABW4W4X1_9BACI